MLLEVHESIIRTVSTDCWFLVFFYLSRLKRLPVNSIQILQKLKAETNL